MSQNYKLKAPAAGASLQARCRPAQSRSEGRLETILDITAQLLDEVGLDRLTTILIAKQLGISIGALYHYFPNKHAILYALAERWVSEVEKSLVNFEKKFDFDALAIPTFAEAIVDEQYLVYTHQQGILPLVRAMYSVPELRELDLRHDDMIVHNLQYFFRRLGFQQTDKELNRIAFVCLELIHAEMMLLVNQNRVRRQRTAADLKCLLTALLQKYSPET